MKKIMSILLSCTGAFVMLAGCSSNSAPSSGAPAPAPASPSAGAPAPSQEKKGRLSQAAYRAHRSGQSRRRHRYQRPSIRRVFLPRNRPDGGCGKRGRRGRFHRDPSGERRRGRRLSAAVLPPERFDRDDHRIVDYDFFEEFKLLALPTSDSTTAFVVGKNCPYNTLNDLVADAKARPARSRSLWRSAPSVTLTLWSWNRPRESI